MKRIILFVVMILLFCFYFVFQNTVAYDYFSDNYTLFYKDNKNELEKDIKKYLEKNGDILITNSEFGDFDVLSNNYSYMVNFALDYILKYSERYLDKFTVLDNYRYYDCHYQMKNTNQYISLDYVYDITDRFFGMRDFKIINNNISLVDNYVPVINYCDDSFLNSLLDVTIEEEAGFIKAYAKYDYGKYLFVFFVKNNVLKIYNIEVVM